MAGPKPAIPQGLRSNVEVRVMNPLHRSAWIRVPILFPWELRRRPVDIFHAHYTVPPWIKAKVVLTLHDFFWLIHPEDFVSIKRYPITHMIKRSVLRADKILVGSSFIMKETISYFSVPQERFEVIPYGVDPRFLKQSDTKQRDKVLRKYGINGPYILAVGDIHPRKNLSRLISAFIALPKNKHISLVLVGKAIWKVENLTERIKKANLQDRIITTGYVVDEDMSVLYQNAEVFCYPSLYEGFGIPIIEAMASGTPVAASGTTSCPETGGEAAVYFDPLNVDTIVEALDRILTDSDLRATLSKAGREWASCFTWDKTAMRTIQAYNKLV